MNSSETDQIIGVKSTLDGGAVVVFDIPHTEADDETEEVTAYEILSTAAGK